VSETVERERDDTAETTAGTEENRDTSGPSSAGETAASDAATDAGGVADDARTHVTEIDRSPTQTSQLLAIIAASVALATSALASSNGGIVGVVGVLVLGAGVFVGSRGLVTGGSFVLLLGVLYGGLLAAPPELLIPGTMATILAWDFGEQAINVGEQLGRDADTQRLETMHAAASTAVAIAAGGLGYGFYMLGSGGQPVTALVFLLIAALALTSALRA
jgi:hypothetical protein